MNKKPPLTPPKGENWGTNDKMSERKINYNGPKVSPLGRFRGALRAATRNPVEALRYE
jgi:hypothetical protein